MTLKTHAYCIIHYGKDYLPYALRSVYDHVEQIHVLYTPHPSHGTATEAPPIETRDQLRGAAYAYDPRTKVRWYDTKNLYQEGRHRDLAVRKCAEAGAEMILVVDCDEVWHSDVLAKALEMAEQANNARAWRINFIHFWRSFSWVCRDQGWPDRIIDLRQDEGYGYIPPDMGEIYHFGYAVTDAVMIYKWLIHGHKDELRGGWLDDIWDDWPPPPDCHPTNDQDFWTPEPFDKEQLPEFMRDHPFWGMERID
ncbi:MAG: hypothetical protein ACYTEQ_11715 [Planctomycetota bacterium]|jgi:hypothetical protein